VCHHTANSFNILPLFSFIIVSTLQESTTIVLKGSSASGALRGASKFLVNKKVDEYALLSKDKGGGGPPGGGGGGGGGNKESGHGGPPSGGGDGKHFILFSFRVLYYLLSYILFLTA